jgi:hypothetical protein
VASGFVCARAAVEYNWDRRAIARIGDSAETAHTGLITKVIDIRLTSENLAYEHLFGIGVKGR